MSRKPPKSNRPAAGPDDDALWSHVARSVTPIGGRRKKARDEAESQKPARKEAAAKPATTKAGPRKAAPPLPPPAKAPPAKTGGFDRSTETKLRRGQLDIEGRIDLHGMTQAQAHAALSRFLSVSVAQERRTLLVITGKGRLSEGGGVLRRLLPLWLQEEPWRGHVLALTQAAQKDGGSGAFYLRLRRRRD